MSVGALGPGARQSDGGGGGKVRGSGRAGWVPVMRGRESVVQAGPSQILLTGIKQVLEATDRYEVVSQAHASGLAPALVRRLCPDYVVLDGTARSHRSSREGVVDTMHGLVQLSKPPGVLVVVAPDQFPLVKELRQAGCRACVSTRSAEAVVRALDMLSQEREFFPEWRAAARRREHVGDASPSGLLEGLNRNEVRILALMARGYSSKEIVPRLGLAVSTVNNYRTRIKAKLGAHTRAEIRRAARTAGLLAPERRPGAVRRVEKGRLPPRTTGSGSST